VSLCLWVWTITFEWNNLSSKYFTVVYHCLMVFKEHFPLVTLNFDLYDLDLRTWFSYCHEPATSISDTKIIHSKSYCPDWHTGLIALREPQNKVIGNGNLFVSAGYSVRGVGDGVQLGSNRQTVQPAARRDLWTRQVTAELHRYA